MKNRIPRAAAAVLKKCTPCSGVRALGIKEARAYIQEMPEWRLSADARSIRTEYVMQDFMAAIDLIRRIARSAETEGHHPDIHLTAYRRLGIELSTHSLSGLSENDFILASKISALPKKLKSRTI